MFCSALPGTRLPPLLDCQENWRAALSRDGEVKHEPTPAGQGDGLQGPPHLCLRALPLC